MKKFYVMLTYMSIKHPQKVLVEAVDSNAARAQAHAKYPNAKIEGPGAVFEVPTVKAI